MASPWAEVRARLRPRATAGSSLAAGVRVNSNSNFVGDVVCGVVEVVAPLERAVEVLSCQGDPPARHGQPHTPTVRWTGGSSPAGTCTSRRPQAFRLAQARTHLVAGGVVSWSRGLVAPNQSSR